MLNQPLACPQSRGLAAKAFDRPVVTHVSLLDLVHRPRCRACTSSCIDGLHTSSLGRLLHQAHQVGLLPIPCKHVNQQRPSLAHRISLNFGIVVELDDPAVSDLRVALKLRLAVGLREH